MRFKQVTTYMSAALVGVLICLCGLVLLSDRTTWNEQLEARKDFTNLAGRLLEYQLGNGRLPPRVYVDPDTQTRHSWRVVLLKDSPPHDLSNYSFHQEYYSPSNIACQTSTDYDLFVSRNLPTPFHRTYIFAASRPGGAFDEERFEETLPRDTILVMQVHQSFVHWMEPRDVELDVARNTDRSQSAADPFFVMFADYKIWKLKHDTPTETLELFFDRDSAAKFSREKLLGPYRLDY